MKIANICMCEINIVFEILLPDLLLFFCAICHSQTGHIALVTLVLAGLLFPNYTVKHAIAPSTKQIYRNLRRTGTCVSTLPGKTLEMRKEPFAGFCKLVHTLQYAREKFYNS